MLRSTVYMLLVLTGCGGDADVIDTVVLDEACATDTYGYDTPSDDAIAALERTNCYRNLMGLEPASLEQRLDQAAQAHAEYMVNHGLNHWQDPSHQDYTGEWAWDRAEAAGYGCMNCSIGEVLAQGVSPDGAVDLWMNSVYHRVPFTQHGWTDAGFGSAGAFSAMTIVSPFPESEDRLVAYPVHGQLEVPTSFQSDSEWPDPAPGLSLVGYPVTVTVVSTTYAAASGVNPYDIELLEATFSGPDGDVDHLQLEPASDDSLYYTVCLLPTSALEAGETYEVEVRVAWAGDNEETATTVFTTAAEQ